ncbi:S8 family peptidase, partial [bacterium]|nr:S8 family peptidase [bacterium]
PEGAVLTKKGFISAAVFLTAAVFFGPAGSSAAGRGGAADLGSLDLRRRHEFRHEARPGVRVAEGRLIVKRRNPALAKTSAAWNAASIRAGVRSVAPRFPGHAGDGSGLSKILDIRLAAGTDPWKAAEMLYADPDVEWAEPVMGRSVRYTPNDPFLLYQWYIGKIRAEEAWDLGRDATSVPIAIVDTGVRRTHPDIAASLWTNPGEIGGNGIDDDGNGFKDDTWGWDFSDSDNDPGPSDIRDQDGFPVGWHGTAVAAAAGAAADDGVGMAGAAFRCRLMAVKGSFDDDPDQSIYDGYAGIVYAADNGAGVINCSWGGTAVSFAEEDAVAYAVGRGCLVVGAAGNEGVSDPFYPASLQGVLAVAATGENDFSAGFSNFGPGIDMSAPGVSIYTAFGTDGYAYWDGTSFSAPMVSGIAALVRTAHPEWTGFQAGEQVRVTADPIDVAEVDRAGGSGRLNAYRALTETRPSLRIENAVFTEGEGANGDGELNRGERVNCTFMVRNHLAASGPVRLMVGVVNGAEAVENYSADLPPLASGETWSNASAPLVIQILESAQIGQRIVLYAFFEYPGCTDLDHMAFNVSYAAGTVAAGNARLTVSSIGRIGFADGQHRFGEGFVFGSEGNLLFEGALMTALSPDSVSDVARGPGDISENDFNAVVGREFTLSVPGPDADQQGTAVFTDADAVPRLGIGVEQTAYAYAYAPDADYVLLSCGFFSTDATQVSGLYAGLFMDWDVEGDADAGSNLGRFDEGRNLASIYEPQSGVHGGLRIFTGGLPVNYRFNRNYREPNFGSEGYTDLGKWEDLSGGIRNTVPSEPGDYSHVLGVGPIDIPAGDTVRIGYAVIGGSSWTGLQAASDAAERKWNFITSVDSSDELKPAVFGLERAFPNPFNGETVIRYSLAEQGPVRIAVMDVRGREAAVLLDGTRSAGRHEARWDGLAAGVPAPSGVYLVRLTSGDRVQTRKILLIR